MFAPTDASIALASLEQSIVSAAHLLPAQGPITVFVHHNTLHALEELPFEEAVMRGAKIFGCQPYLSESRYREELERGRIRNEDLAAVLIDDLGDCADELLGFLGTRFQLRKAMLEHPLLIGPDPEIRWIIAETDALRKCRSETRQVTVRRLVHSTKHWVMRNLSGTISENEASADIRNVIESALTRFEKPHIEKWDPDTWEAFTLQLLWMICQTGGLQAEIHASSDDAESSVPADRFARHRDILLRSTGEDCDLLVHDVLIPFCAAFLDQGLANWPLPQREAGFFAAFVAFVDLPLTSPAKWLRPLRSELRRMFESGTTPLQSIAQSLRVFGVAEECERDFIQQTMLALRGFAGMIWQTETRSDRVAKATPAGSLIEFLAIRLILDRLAAAHVARQSLNFHGSIGELPAAKEELGFAPDEIDHVPCEALEKRLDPRAFLIFQMSQLHGWTPECLQRLSKFEWQRLSREIEAFSGSDRRRVYHLAYERRYRIQILDAIQAHSLSRLGQDRGKDTNKLKGSEHAKISQRREHPENRTSFQVICCIDEREESFRRHLEEIAAECETFGAAGFFSVAMYYRGVPDAHFTPLCPVNIKPQHYVTESVVVPLRETATRRRKRRRMIGTLTHHMHLSSRTLGGGWLAALLGSWVSVPLVMRILFPRLTSQIRQFLGGFVRSPDMTQLQLERSEMEPGAQEGHVGYRVEEMASIVERLLRDIGLQSQISRLVIVLGHGSCSMNNPHESAHDCGACGGGRGGPNARAFAQMANDPRVRAIVRERGLDISNSTWFLGGYHNTCDDSVSFYDLQRMPTDHQADFDVAWAAIDSARKHDAHERSRRFESAPLSLTIEAALRHVQGRAQDLSQVRPEFGHATNAVCLVGRREWSRGLFLDRRSFLQSYDPDLDDPEYSILARILQAVVPVCAGINLEYYFSVVDPSGYGCGTKLPHNITSFLGVMNGAASDLRPGLPWQMVEIHEPLRLLMVVETKPSAILQIMQRNPDIDRLVRGRWIQMATFDPATVDLKLFKNGCFDPYQPESTSLPIAPSSADWYAGWRDHLPPASIISPGVAS